MHAYMHVYREQKPTSQQNEVETGGEEFKKEIFISGGLTCLGAPPSSHVQHHFFIMYVPTSPFFSLLYSHVGGQAVVCRKAELR